MVWGTSAVRTQRKSVLLMLALFLKQLVMMSEARVVFISYPYSNPNCPLWQNGWQLETNGEARRNALDRLTSFIMADRSRSFMILIEASNQYYGLSYSPVNCSLHSCFHTDSCHEYNLSIAEELDIKQISINHEQIFVRIWRGCKG